MNQKFNASLLHGWLLPELADKYNHQTSQVNVESLLMVINLLAASMTLREQEEGGIGGTSADARLLLSIMLSPDEDENYIPIAQVEKLRTDNEAYIEFIHSSYNIIVEKLKQNNLRVGALVSLTNEYKNSVREDSSTFRVALRQNWIHPLAELSGEGTHINSWAFASILCGAATNRCGRKGGNADMAASKLIQLGVIEISKAKSILAACKLIDSDYLMLIQKTKEALDSKAADASGNH